MLPVWLVLCLVIPMFPTSLDCAEQAESGDSSHIISRIPRQRVESTAIAGVGYSRRRHILEIQFVNGAIYRYLDVPAAIILSWFGRGERRKLKTDSKAFIG